MKQASQLQTIQGLRMREYYIHSPYTLEDDVHLYTANGLVKFAA
jgi:hypothetical protein